MKENDYTKFINDGYLESTVENENLSWPEVQLQNGNLVLNPRNQGIQ